MGWTFALRAAEIDSFRRCRRAWDFGARIRRNYSGCLYRAPCDAMEAGLDPAEVLAAHYRKRNQRESEQEDRLRWSAAREQAPQAAGGEDLRSKIVRARWG